MSGDRIRAVRSTPLAIPMRTPYEWRYGDQRGVNAVLFEVETEDGFTGYGEASADHQAASEAIGGMLAEEYFVGRDPAAVEAILRDVWAHGRWGQTRRFTSHVLAGLEVACLDAAGRRLGVPVNALLGGPVRDRVDFFGYVQGESAGQLAEDARRLAGEGFGTLYMKVGRPARGDDVDCVAAVRDAVGPEPRLRVDANEAWTIVDAVERIRQLERFDLDWVEQPVSADDIPGLAEVRRRVATRIAADQAVYTVGELRMVLDQGAADVIVLGQHETGGLWRLRQMAFLAEAHGVEINRHGCFETDVSTCAALQALAAIPNLTTGNQLMHPLLEERIVLAPALEIGAGEIVVPDAPGLGVELDGDAVARACERYRRDGPFPPSGSGRQDAALGTTGGER